MTKMMWIGLKIGVTWLDFSAWGGKKCEHTFCSVLSDIQETFVWKFTGFNH